MRGSQHIQLNSGLSLMQSYGSDIGGFVGPLTTQELFVRWVQLGVMHSRFCIHSAPGDGEGHPKLNTPWMVSERMTALSLVPPSHPHHSLDHQDAVRAATIFVGGPCYRADPSNALMWESHLHADPTNAPMFYGSFHTDPELYTPKLLESFQAWCGVGRILHAPAMFEGQLSQQVYFPKSSTDDTSVYFDWNSPHGIHKAGTWATIATPMEHGGMFVREGAVIPIGHEYASVTATSGSPRTNIGGIDTKLVSEGGVVGLDDWRGVLLFPGQDGTYTGSWIEDDGISSKPDKLELTVTYTGAKDEVRVGVSAYHMGYEPLWKGKIHVVLPIGDDRKVVSMKEGRLWGERKTELQKGEAYKGRTAWIVDVY